ncbi:MAG: serine/threonine protein kinase [Myxococcales bacterium]|nr:serine/threonine protein kinase [Myxococcales bacterium]
MRSQLVEPDIDERTGRGRTEQGSEPYLAGEHFGRYEILFPIASGGMATVYAARLVGDEGFQKPIAIKLMLPHLTRDERFVSMFLDEATLAANVESSNVVSVRDLGREGDTLYMAMDLVIGANLQALLRAGALPPAMAASVIVQTARGLHDAHEARSATGERLELVHRDVSPHNVLIGVDGRVRLSDFGVARAMHRRSHTQTGELKGKLAYFSPEQLEARDVLDRRSDVFALGVVAWEAFRGKRLFAAPNPLALAKLIASHPIPRLDEAAGVPPVIADVIAKALDRDVARRFRNAEEMANALERAARASVGWASPAALGGVVRARGGARVHHLESRIRQVMSEVSGPQPTVALFDEAPTRPNGHRPNEHRPNEHRPNERRPNEHRPNEHRPNEHRPNERRAPQSVLRWLAMTTFVVIAIACGVALGLRSSDAAASSERTELEPEAVAVTPGSTEPPEPADSARPKLAGSARPERAGAERAGAELAASELGGTERTPSECTASEATGAAKATEAAPAIEVARRSVRGVERRRTSVANAEPNSDRASDRSDRLEAHRASSANSAGMRSVLWVDLERFERSLQNGE